MHMPSTIGFAIGRTTCPAESIERGSRHSATGVAIDCEFRQRREFDLPKEFRRKRRVDCMSFSFRKAVKSGHESEKRGELFVSSALLSVTTAAEPRQNGLHRIQKHLPYCPKRHQRHMPYAAVHSAWHAYDRPDGTQNILSNAPFHPVARGSAFTQRTRC